MAEEKSLKNLHVIVLPYHGQGHMNPMLQFSKRLASKGVQITLATTVSVTEKMKSNIGVKSITLESIYDDSDESQLGSNSPLGFKLRMEKFEQHGSQGLTDLIANHSNPNPIKCLVYDANLPWALNVAKNQGIYGAAFFTQACASIAAYYPLHLESFGKDSGDLPPLSVMPPPGVLQLGLPNLPSLGSSADSGAGKQLHPVLRMVFNQFSTLDDADWVLFNSYDKLEEEVVKWMQNLWPVKTIGPTLPSAYLDKRVENDVDYGFNLYKPNNDACMNWLNTKEPDSVVYIAFGSAAHLSVEQMSAIAEALKQIPSNFLWIVRETEQSKLPSNFISETSEKGLVVSWCPQLDVLSHEAVGCFVTHCGWNSTIEALSFGVPMLAMPQFLDQMIDAYFVDHVWGVGIQPKKDENGLVTREEIGHCLEEIMQGKRGEKIKEKAAMWKALAKEAVDEGGSSDKHIDEIIARLASN